ncbi:MAG: hypothetical protein ACI915_000492 [Gammaproteobacteria bacterium]|jgi:hypothetical protein
MAHIRKYDFDYSRRHFMEKTAKGFGAAGVLGSLWPIMAKTGEINMAYPDELLSIEAYTKGRINTGDWITADNIDDVKDLVDAGLYHEVKQQGRKFLIQASTTDITKMFPHEFMEATLTNAGRAEFDDVGNVWTDDGSQWIGGLPFPNAKTGLEVIANMTLSWGRHDESTYAMIADAVNAQGEVAYKYSMIWAEQAASGRLKGPSMMSEGRGEGKMRYQSTWFSAPNDVKGTAFINIWPYDQREFPDLFGYLPAFKRVRRFPTNQRFEPLVAGLNFYLSDAWAAGDPYLTWGNYKIVGRGPFLGSSQGGWMGDLPGWRPETHGGPKDETFFTVTKELIPEVIILEAEPTGFPRSPYSKKRCYVDARNMIFPTFLSYDRRGDLFKVGEPGFGQYKTENNVKMDGDHPAWSWTWYHSHDMQGDTMSRIQQSDEVQGGYKSVYNEGDLYDKYMTKAAMRRLGT